MHKPGVDQDDAAYHQNDDGILDELQKSLAAHGGIVMPAPDQQVSLKKTPEEWLEKTATEDQKAGLLKVFLGYAPGVGKTFNMLSEAIRRHQRGEDVVIGVVETHNRPRTAELAAKLETIPRKRLEFRGTVFEEMDLDAILARKPQVVLVDELAHTNIEGSRHGKRYEDVLDLLDAKITVLSTVNIQHVESVTPVVRNLTGVVVRETIPDWVLRRADEIVLADLTPEALQTRMNRGDIYPSERAAQALSNFFRRGNLIALRELALQQVTRAVDRNLDEYVQRKHLGGSWAVQERIVVCISANPAAQELIARGARMAERCDGELYVVHVKVDDPRPERAKTLASNLRFAQNQNATIVELQGKSVPLAVAEFVTQNRATQVIFGRSAVTGLKKYLYYWGIKRFLERAPFIDVHIITQIS